MKSKSIKTRSGVTVRWRNGRRNVQVRLKGFPFRSRSFPEGTTEEEAREWGLETARKLKLRDVPTLAHKITKELTLKYLIEDYQRQCHLAFLTGIVSVKDVLEGLLGSQQAAQEMLDGLQDVTTIYQSHKLRLVSNS